MEQGNHTIPADIAKLIVGFFHYSLTPEEHDKLDEWLCLSDENVRIFEDCVEMAQRPVQLQAAPAMYEEERELRYIVELIIKHLHQTITEEERKTLDEWACSSEYNKKFLEEMPQTSDMEKVYYWFVERLIREQNKIDLN